MCYRHSLQDAKMQEKSRTRNCERTNQKVTAIYTKEVLIVKIFMNNLCVHCTVPAKFKSQLVIIFHMCLLLRQLFLLTVLVAQYNKRIVNPTK